MRAKAYYCVCLWIMAALAGCVSQPGERVAMQEAGPAQSEADGVCLADPAGNSVLDSKIRSLQRQASAIPGKTESWILTGRAWVQKARISMDPGFYINVESCARAALEREASSTTARSLLALTMMNDHRFGEARAAAEEVLHIDPQDLIAHGIRSDALLELGQFDLAATAVQQMMDIRPDMASYSRASYIRWMVGDNNGAKSLIREALETRDARDPEPAAWTYVQAGQLFWNEGDYEGAEAVFEEALKWVSDYPPALVGAGRAALSQKEPQRAEQLLARAYNLYPLAETAWLLGDARRMLGDASGADRAYRNVVELGKKSDPLTLAFFYAVNNQNLDEALQLAEEERTKRRSIYVEDTYSWVLYRLGRSGEARSISDGLVRMGTQNARILYHAGAIQLATGERKGSELILRALALNPAFDLVESKEALLLQDNEKTTSVTEPQRSAR